MPFVNFLQIPFETFVCLHQTSVTWCYKPQYLLRIFSQFIFLRVSPTSINGMKYYTCCLERLYKIVLFKFYTKITTKNFLEFHVLWSEFEKKRMNAKTKYLHACIKI
jgi:hypothetical protein